MAYQDAAAQCVRKHDSIERRHYERVPSLRSCYAAATRCPVLTSAVSLPETSSCLTALPSLQGIIHFF
eukprot:2524695-Rhodomonas_salina.2